MKKPYVSPYIFLIVSICVIVVIYFAFASHPADLKPMSKGEKTMGTVLPSRDEVEFLFKYEPATMGGVGMKALHMQLTNEQASQFEQDILATDFWYPLPLPPDIEAASSFLSGNLDRETYNAISSANGYWMLYNAREDTHAFRMLTYHDTRAFTFAIYNADSKQLFIHEGGLY